MYPVFANAAFTEELSPLLMFDFAEPKKFAAKVGPPRGVGQHPHRGFETVTVAFQGEVEHQDSMGNRGVIQQGDVQWMTAGRGIIHEEYHSKEFTREGGTFEVSAFGNMEMSRTIDMAFSLSYSRADVPIVGEPAKKVQNEQAQIPAYPQRPDSRSVLTRRCQ